MTPNEHQTLTLQAEKNVDDNGLLLPRNTRLLNDLMRLNGEVSEVIDILKKHLFQGHDLNREHLAKVLGDVAWYLEVSAYTLGYSLEELLEIGIRMELKRNES